MPVKELTDRQIILKLISDEPYRKFKTHELMMKETRYGWIGTSGNVRARELAREGKINRNSEGDKEALFWYKPEEPKQLSLLP